MQIRIPNKNIWALWRVLEIISIFSIIFLVSTFYGCAATQPQIVYETKYIDRNCTKPDEVIDRLLWLPIRWVAIDTENTRFYCTEDGASLLGNIKSKKENK
jgi:hypothetical protein